MPNAENIIPYQLKQGRNSEKSQEVRRLGGLASGEARRAKKAAREEASAVLAMIPKLPPQTLNTLARLGMKGRAKPNIQLLSMLAIAQKAMKGDKSCLESLLRMAGELTPEEVVVSSRTISDEAKESIDRLLEETKGEVR